jgi:hypothetical protein
MISSAKRFSRGGVTVKRPGQSLGTAWTIRTPEEKRAFGRQFHNPVTIIRHRLGCGALYSELCNCHSP